MHTKTRQIKKLTQQNEVLENYFRNTIIPQFFIDADLILRKFTPAAMQQFKLTENDIGEYIYDIQDKFRFKNISDDILYVIKSNDIVEKEIQTTDLRWYQMNILPYITRKENETNGVIVTFIEVTQRIKDLKEQEELVAEFELLLDTIAHDIKSPLVSLAMAIDLFKNDAFASTEDLKMFVQIIGDSLSKMQNLINELTYTRIEQHKYDAAAELISFENVMEDVKLTLSEDIQKSGAVIKSELHVPEIYFSRRKVRSALYNLFCNAIKYKSPKRTPEIFFTTKRENGFVVVTVKDNGIGIDSKNKEVIFSKYFRVEHAVDGCGIGLFLVKELVTNGGGKIEVNSELGIGTEFKIFLKEH